MRIRKIALALGLMAVVATGTTGVALAEESVPADQVADRLDVACARIPITENRVEAILTRIQGDADVVGSIAWLEAKALQADAAGREDLANMIRLRINVRAERVDVLENRLVRLGELSASCDEFGA